jgi:small-conductance mechanosensitive channel
LAFVLGFILLTTLLSACGSGTAAPMATATVVPTSTSGPTATATVAPASTSGPMATATVAPASTSGPMATAAPETTATPAEESGGPSIPDVGQVSTSVAERTPVPTPTPGPVQVKVDQLATDLGLAGKSFLGLTTDDWINLALSVVLVLVGYLVGGMLLFALLRRLVRRTSTTFDDDFLAAIGAQLKLLVVLFFTRYATLRLDFLSDQLRTILDDIFFGLGWVLVLRIVVRLIDFGATWYKDNAEPQEDRDRLDPIIMVLQRLGYVLVIIVGVSIGLSHFGLDITALSAVLVFAALVISLGAKDIISDAISGFVILIDQPFRVGDVIEIEELNKWGDVVNIGTRSTRIRTRDNRFAIVPNSTIGASQVINYTFPDPKFRVQTEIGVAYGSDFDQVRRVATAAVQGVEGVLHDKPVQVLSYKFGDSARMMRVRWWIDDMHSEARTTDGVIEALEMAFDKAGIDMPFNTENLVVQVDPETMKQFSPSRKEPDSLGDRPAVGSDPDEGETDQQDETVP